jgi:hypothetical protein
MFKRQLLSSVSPSPALSGLRERGKQGPRRKKPLARNQKKRMNIGRSRRGERREAIRLATCDVIEAEQVALRGGVSMRRLRQVLHGRVDVKRDPDGHQELIRNYVRARQRLAKELAA